jgi:uncharacterized protein
MIKKKNRPRRAVIFDVMYGFIPITEWEEKIINSPFFQRLRWIKQLGFSNYIFPGAEHNRFAHVIGVMHSMQEMLEATGLAVDEEELFNPNARGEEAMLHKSLRIAALLHDLGTFPFSHAVEYAYMRHGNARDSRSTREGKTKTPKPLSNNHEHLGAFIIKNTPFAGGITEILESYHLDVQMISKIIKGESPYPVANQLMHSDLDADRMDYLLRDAHYTGIKYGQFDRDYILANLVSYETKDGELGFGVRENAAHAAEDFLIARFSWYSQVIKNQASAKFDIMSSHVAKSLLEKDHLFQFHDLLTMIEKQDQRFFWWNDIYFMTRCQDVHYKQLLKDPREAELLEMLLYRKAPKTIRHPLFDHTLIKDRPEERERRLRAIKEKVAEMEGVLKKFGTGREWILADLPEKDVVFTKKPKSKEQKGATSSVTREALKIVDKWGKPSLITERPNSLMKHLGEFVNFVPSVYANEHAYQLLKKKKLIE